MLAIDQDRPPYLQWGFKPMEDRKASQEKGHVVMVDVEVVTIMRPGSKDSTEKLAADYIADIKKKTGDQQIPPTWLPAILASYENWKRGEAPPPNGTSIKNWPAISGAQAANIIRAGIFTIEDLAAIPDNELNILPVGGLNLRQMARSWLQAAEDKGKVAAENAALKAKVSDLETQVESMFKEIQAIKLAQTLKK